MVNEMAVDDLTMVNEMAAGNFPLTIKNECVPHSLSEELRRKRSTPRVPVNGHFFSEPVSCKCILFVVVMFWSVLLCLFVLCFFVLFRHVPVFERSFCVFAHNFFLLNL